MSFGQVARWVGDQDGDGYPDFLCSRRRKGQEALALVLVSGRSVQEIGALPHWLGKLERWSSFSIDAVGLSGSGPASLVVSASCSRPTASSVPDDALIGYSRDRAEAFRVSYPQQLFGGQLENIGDVDGDGQEDVAIGADEYLLWRGAVLACSGRTGEPIWRRDGSEDDRHYASRMSAADVDGDGTMELAVGSGSWQCGGPGSNRIEILGCASGETLLTIRQEDGGVVFHGASRSK